MAMAATLRTGTGYYAEAVVSGNPTHFILRGKGPTACHVGELLGYLPTTEGLDLGFNEYGEGTYSRQRIARFLSNDRSTERSMVILPHESEDQVIITPSILEIIVHHPTPAKSSSLSTSNMPSFAPASSHP